jgi:hypothetical protein
LAEPGRYRIVHGMETPLFHVKQGSVEEPELESGRNGSWRALFRLCALAWK